jgi:hypothetical protein
MRYLAVITTTALLAGAASPAYAGDAKVYPAAMCQGSVPELRTTTINVGTSPVPITVHYIIDKSVTRQGTGTAMNGSSDFEMPVLCPVVRDVARGDGLGWSSLFVNALNMSATRNLTCLAKTFHKSDHDFGGNFSSNTLPANRDWTDLSFPVLGIPVDGYMLVSCTIPRRDPGGFPSGLASYRVDE